MDDYYRVAFSEVTWIPLSTSDTLNKRLCDFAVVALSQL